MSPRMKCYPTSSNQCIANSRPNAQLQDQVSLVESSIIAPIIWAQFLQKYQKCLTKNKASFLLGPSKSIFILGFQGGR